MLRLRLLGGFLLEVDGTPAPRLRSRAGESLLALLTLRAGLPVERLWLAGALWPESTHEQGLYNLRRNLTDLRMALSSEAYRLQAPSKNTLLFELEGAPCDLLAFDGAVAAGRWQEAVSHYGGPLLTSSEEAWIEAERTRREQSFLLALERAAEQLSPAEALPLLERARALDPLRESVVRSLMRCHQSLGSPARAQQCYHELRAQLIDARLGEPDSQTLALYASQEQAQTAWNNLPPPPTLFIGREAILSRCADALCQEHVRLLTLVGMGGIGKTRIALETARRLHSRFTHGALWVSLEDAAEKEALLYRLAEALGIAPTPDTPLTKQLLAPLREKRALLVLDNAEDSPDAPEQVQWLLQTLPELTVLVTSRASLELQAERVLEITPLPPQESEALLIARGRAQSQDFARTPENAQDLEALCLKLEGIPLALELAAARIGTLTPRELLQRLRQRFRLLQSSARDLPTRQRTLRAVLESSCGLLSAEERNVFNQLSVFVGGFTLNDAEAVCESAGVLESIHTLRRHALVLAQTQPQTQQIRFRFLETLREFGQENLSETTRAAHARHFACRARQERARFRTTQEPEALLWLEQERLNLQAALQLPSLCAAERGECALALAGLLVRRGFARAAQEPLELALPALEGSLRQEALCEWAGVCLDLQHLSKAEQAAREACALAEALQDASGLARAQNLLGQVALLEERPEAARLYFTQALGYFETQHSSEAAFVHNNLGLIEGETGGVERAWLHFEQARALYLEYQNQRGLARVENNAGYVAYLQREFAQAAYHYQQAGLAAQLCADQDLLAKALNNQGEALEELGQQVQARALYQEALKLFQELDSPYASYTLARMEKLA